MKYEILGAERNVTNTIHADLDFVNENFPGCFREVEESPTPPICQPLSRLDFFNKFTDAELAAIYTAAKSSVQVEIMLDKFKAAEDIRLDDQRLIDGINALEAAQLIGAGRAAEILL